MDILNANTSYRPHRKELEGRVARNLVKEIREENLMSKAELARKAGVSPLTIDRVEKGMNCRMETKRKIILALGYKLSDKHKIFPED
ncbi:MAG: XRE family transcriptional regulator [Deltaproteobacteria bacterium]|nr:MAG: XRE family transcriptional regulator [Deltaproteobacteria bacterium]